MYILLWSIDTKELNDVPDYKITFKCYFYIKMAFLYINTFYINLVSFLISLYWARQLRFINLYIYIFIQQRIIKSLLCKIIFMGVNVFADWLIDSKHISQSNTANIKYKTPLQKHLIFIGNFLGVECWTHGRVMHRAENFPCIITFIPPNSPWGTTKGPILSMRMRSRQKVTRHYSWSHIW